MTKITESKLTITGQSGAGYEFGLYTMDTQFNNVGGIYVFTKRSVSGNHTYIYCGRTQDFPSRFSDHHKSDEIEANGANCIGVMVVSDHDRRVEIETDILQGNNFVCNEVLN